MKRLAQVIVVLVSVAFIVAGCGDKVPRGAIAKVGSGVVTKAQFDEIINQAKKIAKQPGQQQFPKVGSYGYNQFAANVVDYLVTQEVLLQAAKDLRLSVTQKEVTAYIKQVEESYGGVKKLDAELKNLGMTRAQLDRSVKDQLTAQKVQAHVIKTAKVSNAEIKKYYDNNIEYFSIAESRTMRHILVKTKAEADTVRALLVGGASWKDVAKQYSTDPGSKNSGGDLGSVTPGMMVPAFDKAAFALKVNQISQPVKTDLGWHVIQVTKITAAKKSTLAQATSEIKSTLLAEKQKTVWTNWLKKAMKDAKIMYAAGYDPAKLRKTKSPSPTPSTTGSSSPTTSGSPQASPSPSSTT